MMHRTSVRLATAKPIPQHEDSSWHPPRRKARVAIAEFSGAVSHFYARRRTLFRRLTTTDLLHTRTARGSVSSDLVNWARRFQRALVLSDCVIVVMAVAVALFTQYALTPSQRQATEVFLGSSAVAGVLGAVWLGMLAIFRTRAVRNLGLGFAEYRGVVSSSLYTFGILAIAFLVLQVETARGFFMVALPLGLGALLLDRWLWRRWLNHRRATGHYLSRAIVVGDPADVAYVVRQMDKKSGAVYNVIGVGLPQGRSARITFAADAVPVIADLSNIAAAVRATKADAVIVAGEPRSPSHFIRDLGWELEGLGAELVVASALTNIAGPRIHFRPVEGLPLMHVELPNYDGGKHTLKRVLDITLASLALVALIPVFIAVAIAIRREGPGPVLFRQERVGRNGETFHMLKFRSMVTTAETDLLDLLDRNEGSGVLFKMKNDPRITRVGRFLRRYSLDEVPQFWNVLIGDMSLVGPRPPLRTEVMRYENHVRRRLYIKPGLTGMWQVNGRSDLSWEESVRLDLYYVENWSLTGDLIILWRTFRVLVSPSGAY